MKSITYVYIFVLYILFIPGFLIKVKLNVETYLLYSFLFALFFYCTFDLINNPFETFQQDYNIDVKGVDSLVNLLKTQMNNEEPKQIEINNQMSDGNGSGNAQCWNALGKNQKELEIIKTQLDHYSGTKESVDKLNKQLNGQKAELEKLEKEAKTYEGTKGDVDQIRSKILKYQEEIDELRKKVNLYNTTQESIGKINEKIETMQSCVTELNTKIGTCNGINGIKESNINYLTGKIDQQNYITIPNLKTEIENLQEQIENKDNCYVTMTQHCNFRGWKKKYGIGNVSIAPDGGISSIDVPEGLMIQIYSMENFGRIWNPFLRIWIISKNVKTAVIRGPRNISCLTSFSDNANFGDNGSITNWNDKIKSFKIMET